MRQTRYSTDPQGHAMRGAFVLLQSIRAQYTMSQGVQGGAWMPTSVISQTVAGTMLEQHATLASIGRILKPRIIHLAAISDHIVAISLPDRLGPSCGYNPLQ